MALNVADLTARLGLNLSEFTKGLEGALKGLDAFGRSGGVLAKALSLQFAGIATAAVAAGVAFDKAFDSIRIGTGATGRALEGLERDFRSVFRDVPTSTGQVSSAITELNVRLGLTGQPLRDLSTQFLTLARITGQDVNPLIREGTRVFNDWGVATEDQGRILDVFFRVSQRTGVGVGELLGQVGHAGPAFRQLGFSIEESAAMFGQFEKQGINAQAVAMGLQRGLVNLAKSGEEPRVVFNRLVDGIKKATDAQEAITLAAGIFGNRIAGQFVNAVRSGKLEMKEFADSVTKGGDTIAGAARDTDGFVEMMVLLKNRVTDALEPLGTDLLRVMERYVVPALTHGVEVLRGMIRAFVELPEAVRFAMFTFGGVLAVLTSVSTVLGGIGSMLGAGALLTGWGFMAKAAVVGLSLIAAHPVMAAILAGTALVTILWSFAPAGGEGPTPPKDDTLGDIANIGTITSGSKDLGTILKNLKFLLLSIPAVWTAFGLSAATGIAAVVAALVILEMKTGAVTEGIKGLADAARGLGIVVVQSSSAVVKALDPIVNVLGGVYALWPSQVKDALGAVAGEIAGFIERIAFLLPGAVAGGVIGFIFGGPVGLALGTAGGVVLANIVESLRQIGSEAKEAAGSVESVWKLMGLLKGGKVAAPSTQEITDALAALGKVKVPAIAAPAVIPMKKLTQEQVQAFAELNEQLRVAPMNAFELDVRALTKAFEEADPAVQKVVKQLAHLVVGIKDARQVNEAYIKTLVDEVEPYERLASATNDFVDAGRIAASVGEAQRKEFDELFSVVDFGPTAYSALSEEINNLDFELRAQQAALRGTSTEVLRNVEALRKFKVGYQELDAPERKAIDRVVEQQQKLAALRRAQDFVQAGYSNVAAASMASTLQQLESAKTFFGAFQAGALQFAAQSSSMWVGLKDLTVQTLGIVQGTLSSALFDYFKTGALDMQKVWTGLMDSMLKALADFMAAQAVKQFMGVFFGMGGGGGGGMAAGASTSPACSASARAASSAARSTSSRASSAAAGAAAQATSAPTSSIFRGWITS